jgi:hypothetical protein
MPCPPVSGHLTINGPGASVDRDGKWRPHRTSVFSR